MSDMNSVVHFEMPPHERRAGANSGLCHGADRANIGREPRANEERNANRIADQEANLPRL
jgi:hypothetical protein